MGSIKLDFDVEPPPSVPASPVIIPTPNRIVPQAISPSIKLRNYLGSLPRKVFLWGALAIFLLVAAISLAKYLAVFRLQRDADRIAHLIAIKKQADTAYSKKSLLEAKAQYESFLSSAKRQEFSEASIRDAVDDARRRLQVITEEIRKAELRARFRDLDIFQAAARGATERVQELLQELPERSRKVADVLKSGESPTIDEKLRSMEQELKQQWAGEAQRRTPLHLAANKEIARLLIANGASVDATDGNRRTALHIAVERQDIGLVEIIVANGGNLNATDKKRNTPLQYAAKSKNIGILKYLLEKGADPEGDVKQGEGSYSDQGESPLYAAATAGDVECVRTLLAKGAKVNSISRFGTALHGVAWGSDSRHIEVAKLLLESGADVNAARSTRRSSSYDDETPLDDAVERDNAQMAKYLRSKGGKTTK